MLVSVVVATYSKKMLPHLMECVDSLFDQSYTDVEIICIVDGDAEYYELLKKELEGVRLYVNDRNLGLLLTRNRGAKIADGEVVAFIDDDAVADRKWIEGLVEMYEKYDAIAAGGKLKPLWIEKEPVWFPEEFYWMIGATHLGFPETIAEVRNTFGSNLSFRRDVFLELGGFNPDMGGIKGSRVLQGGETELCDRMRKKYGKGVMYNPNAVVYHKIFATRLKMKYLSRRAFWQGYSKAVMERISGEIKEERSFLRFLLRDRVTSRVRRIYRDYETLKLAVMLYFTFLVGAGYVFGKLRR